MGGGINQTESKDMKGKDYELYIYGYRYIQGCDDERIVSKEKLVWHGIVVEKTCLKDL